MKFNRRQFIKASGVAFALPVFESFGATEKQLNPKRMVAICNNLSLLTDNFKPVDSGRDYTPSRYLNFLQDYRNKFTSFSGVFHPEVDGGHSGEKSFLTCAAHPALGSFKNSISLDQLAVDHIGSETRFPSLVLTSNGPRSLSWTRAGVPIPADQTPSRLYSKLFINGSKAEVDKQVLRLKMGKSVMDSIYGKAKRLEKQLTAADKEKFDEYVTSVRQVEKQMVRMQEWEKKPKPKVDYKKPKDIPGRADVIGKAGLMFDLMHLALKTDSTRLITINMQGEFIVPPVEGVTEGYHTLSHNGRNKDKLRQLALIEDEHMKIFRDFLGKLDGVQEAGKTLLDNTMVLYGSNMGNASSHDNRNLPVILAGGGFKHGQHLAYDPIRNEALANLFVTMLQNLGVETDKFGSSTRGYLKGFE
ncbi:MAG: DUF1552 domain-containing protein [Lentisphaeraceae bacterium]|nr:DUF1552 domain-containing protein [Lentisphaeraceae bacterium]